MNLDPERHCVKESNAALRILPGTTLYSVTFFSDRILLAFHRAKIVVRTDLYLRKDGGKTILENNPDWIDYLADCVWKEVISAEQASDTDLSITFANGVSIMLSLRQKDWTGVPPIHLSFEWSW